MSKRRDEDLISDMQEAMQRIARYIEPLTYDTFLRDTKTQDAVLRNLEIIGEASKYVSANLRDCTPHLPWKSMAGMRDRLIHHYFGVNLDIVWQVITIELPTVATTLERIRNV